MQLGDFGFAGDDHAVPFQVDGLEVRGRIVQLGTVLETILDRHAYPERVSEILAEALVLVVLLGNSLKLQGRFVLQTQTDGPVSLLIADYSAPGAVRAYAKFDRDRLAAAEAEGGRHALIGSGILALTIDQGEHAKRYQGIVRLDGRGLEEAVREYFRQSEQIPTELRLGVGRLVEPGSPGRWRAGGLFAQFLPESSRARPPVDLPSGNEAADAATPPPPDDAWTEALALIDTIDRFELVDPTVGAERLLYRLFHERGVRVFDGTAIADRCRCSRERALSIVRGFSAQEIEEFTEAGRIRVNCEFCSTEYAFDPALFEAAPSEA
jgi:molecular chaperone Hsp33